MDRGPRLASQVSSNLCADLFSLFAFASAFYRRSRLSQFTVSFAFRQPFCFYSLAEPLIIVDSGCNSASKHSEDSQRSAPVKSLLRKLRKNNQQKRETFARANLGSRRFLSGSCNGIVLCGIPYRGSGALASPVPTNRLLSSLTGRLPLRSQGCPRSSTADKQLSEITTDLSDLQAKCLNPSRHSNCLLRCSLICFVQLVSFIASVCRSARLQLSKISNRPVGMQGRCGTLLPRRCGKLGMNCNNRRCP